MTLPSGEQIAIAHGDQRAVVAEIGATLRTYVTAGVPVVEGFAADERSSGGRGQVLFPWPNRLGEGQWEYSGRTGRPQLEDSRERTGRHGTVRWSAFAIESFNQNRCVLSLLVHPSPAYPFTVSLEVAYHLGALGLTCTSTVTNRDDVPIPFGLGFHPYLAVTTPTIEGAELCVPARAYLPTDERLLPTGEILPVDGAAVDFRTAKSLSGHELNVTYTELLRDDSGMATAVVRDASGGEVELSVDRTFPYLQVYTGDQLGRGRRRTAVAVEPMTCPPEALRSGKDVVLLEPGQRWAGSWRIRRRA